MNCLKVSVFCSVFFTPVPPWNKAFISRHDPKSKRGTNKWGKCIRSRPKFIFFPYCKRFVVVQTPVCQITHLSLRGLRDLLIKVGKIYPAIFMFIQGVLKCSPGTICVTQSAPSKVSQITGKQSQLQKSHPNSNEAMMLDSPNCTFVYIGHVILHIWSITVLYCRPISRISHLLSGPPWP